MRKTATVVTWAAMFGGGPFGARAAHATVTPLPATSVACTFLDGEPVGTATLIFHNGSGGDININALEIAAAPWPCEGYSVDWDDNDDGVWRAGDNAVEVTINGGDLTPPSCTFVFSGEPADQVYAVQVDAYGCSGFGDYGFDPYVTVFGDTPQGGTSSSQSATIYGVTSTFQVDLGNLPGAAFVSPCGGETSCPIEVAGSATFTMQHAPAAPALGTMQAQLELSDPATASPIGTAKLEGTATPLPEFIVAMTGVQRARPRLVSHLHPQGVFTRLQFANATSIAPFYVQPLGTSCDDNNYYDCVVADAFHAGTVELNCIADAVAYYSDVLLTSTTTDAAPLLQPITCAGVRLVDEVGDQVMPIAGGGLDLGIVPWGLGPTTRTLTLRTPGDVGLEDDNGEPRIALADVDGSSRFSLGPIEATQAGEEILWTIPVTYERSDAPGPINDSDTLTLAFGGDGDVFDVPLQAKPRTAAATISGATVSACPGDELTLPWKLINSGQTSLLPLAGNGPTSDGYTVDTTGIPDELAPGDEKAFSSTGIAPLEVGEHTVAMVWPLPLSGTDETAGLAKVVVEPDLVVTPASHEFGEIEVGQASEPISVEARPCQSELEALEVQVAGDVSQFTITLESGDANATSPLQGMVTFTPTRPGVAAMTLTVGSQTISFGGEGLGGSGQDDDATDATDDPTDAGAEPGAVSYYACATGTPGGGALVLVVCLGLLLRRSPRRSR